MLLGTDVRDELCEVEEICSGTSLISSAIINWGVHHLHELRREIKLFFICCTCCILSVPFAQLEVYVSGSAEETLRITNVGVLTNIWPIA